MADADAGTGGNQPAPTIAQAPSFCRLCDVELSCLQTWKAHVKSDAHVYRLRLKIEGPEGVVASPTPPPGSGAARTKSKAPSRAKRREEPDVVNSAAPDEPVASDTEENETAAAPDFIAGTCLFCMQEESSSSSTVDDSMRHMATAHGFDVPFQDCLAVDLETVVRYLHLVISGWRECIWCGTQRSTVEGVQQHMVAKGHCRFDISPDTEEFYQLPRSANIVVEQTQRDESMPVRLPSGKLISHRKNLDTQEPRAPRRTTTPDRHLESIGLHSKHPPTSTSTSTSTSTPGLEVAHQQGQDRGANSSSSREIVHRSSEAILAAQLSRLRVAGDRAQQKQEERKRGRLERANNAISLKRFRLDSADSRMGRQF